MADPKKNNVPPAWADRFLTWFCRPELLEEIQGDIYELYDEDMQNTSPHRASRRFIWNVLRSFRLSTIRPLTMFSTMLLKNDFKIAVRTIQRNKWYALIKLGGLVIGITACLLIGLFIADELSYDQHIPDKERTYRLYMDWATEGKVEQGTSMPPPLTETLKDVFPEVEEAGRINNFNTLNGPGSNQFRRADRAHNTFEDGFVYADQDILDIFQFPFQDGDPATALSSPNALVISASKAQKYFPNENPMGKHVILNDQEDRPFEITGILADTKQKSHLNYDFYLSMAGHEFWEGEQNNWNINLYDVFLKLRPGHESDQFERELAYIVREYYAPAIVTKGFAQSVDEFVQKVQFRLQPIADVYLKSSNIYDNFVHGDIRFVWLFTIIALLILSLAAINFVNLTTAKATRRAQEVGVRKVLGSSRSSLISQFMVETIAYAFFGLILAVVLTWAILPMFNNLSGKDLSLPWLHPAFLLTLAGLALVLGILAGIYPALYLSAFRPVNALKGNPILGGSRQNLQNGLVIFQFCTAAILIICTLMVQRQMSYILNKELGFAKDQILTIHGLESVPEKVHTLRDQLLALPEVNNLSVSAFIPVEGGKRSGWPMWEDNKKEEKQILVQRWPVDHNYLKTYGIDLLEGRDFNQNMALDSQAMIVNQAFVDKLNLEEPIGKVIGGGWINRTIIGVVKNFHFETFTDQIGPLAFILGNSSESISVNVNPQNVSRLLPAMASIWKRHIPNQELRYEMLDDRFAKMYDNIKRMRSIFTSFAAIAVGLACLGLLALMSFIVEPRSKEISIRKVLGASVPNLFMLLIRNFMLLVLFSIVLALPVAWYLIQQWLKDFVYRTSIAVQPFLMAAIVLMIIALFAISHQAIRAALRNPMEAIQSGD